MKILFIGDSITRGNVGASFVEKIRKSHPADTIINKGVNGDTLTNILKRLIDELTTTPDYDSIVLQGGYNDILLQEFALKSNMFRLAVKRQQQRGLTPLISMEAVEETLSTAIDKIKELSKARLIITTLGCINENQASASNQKRADMNKVIKKVAADKNIALADCGRLFDNMLNGSPQTNHLMETFGATALTDRLVSAFEKGPQLLSKTRKLLLTIDGVHLNLRGAELFKQEIEKQLSKQ